MFQDILRGRVSCVGHLFWGMDPNFISLAVWCMTFTEYILKHLASESWDIFLLKNTMQKKCYTSSSNEKNLCEGGAASQIQYKVLGGSYILLPHVVGQEDSLSRDIKGLIMIGSEPAGCRPTATHHPWHLWTIPFTAHSQGANCRSNVVTALSQIARAAKNT